MKVRIRKPQAQNGLQVENNGLRPLSPTIGTLVGPSHNQGGVDVNYAGKTVEGQGGEPVSIDNEGALVFFGKMEDLTNGKTFESQAKKLAKEENKNMKVSDKGNNLITNSSPYDRYELGSFNSGVVLADAANINLNKVNQDKELLGQRQQLQLDFENQGKKKAQYGSRIVNNLLQPLPQYATMPDIPVPAPPGAMTPVDIVAPNEGGSLAQRNNNPGNIKYIGQKGATRGEGGFARFNSYEEGLAALENDLRAKQTGKSRNKTLGPDASLLDLMKVYSPAADSNDPVRLAQILGKGMGGDMNMKIGNLDTKKLALLVAKNEDASYARQKGTTPAPAPKRATTTDAPAPSPTEPPKEMTPEEMMAYRKRNSGTLTPIDSLTAPRPLTLDQPVGVERSRQEFARAISPQVKAEQKRSPRNTLTPLDYLPEIAAILDRPDYVEGQQYSPELMDPYRVSFQDQINQNQGTFNALSRNFSDNPEALATLAGQKYQQDQGILANEFRTNQGIANEVANQNNQILNQAALTNLQLDDTQQQRQQQAIANTEAARNAALTSISNKYQQNRAVNNALDQTDQRTRLMENFFNYRTNDQGQYDYTGPDAQFMFPQGQTDPTQGMTPKQQRDYYNAQKAKQDAEAKRLANAQAASKLTRYAFGGKIDKFKTK